MILKRLQDRNFRYQIMEVYLYEKGQVRKVYPIKKR